MPSDNTIVVKLDDGGRMVVDATPVGGIPVAATDIVAKLSEISDSIERVSSVMLDAVRRAGPTKATVELGFGLALETGQVVALFGKAHGDASISVTLEWSRDEARPRVESPDPATPGQVR